MVTRNYRSLPMHRIPYMDLSEAQVACLQGQMAQRHWQAGRFEARYVKGTDGWKIATMRFT